MLYSIVPRATSSQGHIVVYHSQRSKTPKTRIIFGMWLRTRSTSTRMFNKNLYPPLKSYAPPSLTCKPAFNRQVPNIYSYTAVKPLSGKTIASKAVRCLQLQRQIFVIEWTHTKSYYMDNIKNVVDGDYLGTKMFKTT